MKTKLRYLFIVLALLADIYQTAAQLPVISSFSQNGALVCTNLQPATVASVEWASSLSGPWNTNWVGLDAVTVNSNGTISVSVPMFYRVRGVAPVTNSPVTIYPRINNSTYLRRRIILCGQYAPCVCQRQ